MSDDKIIPITRKRDQQNAASQDRMDQGIDILSDACSRLNDIGYSDFGCVFMTPDGRIFSIGMIEVFDHPSAPKRPDPSPA